MVGIVNSDGGKVSEDFNLTGNREGAIACQVEIAIMIRPRWGRGIVVDIYCY